MFTDYYVYQGPKGLIYYTIANIDKGMEVALYSGMEKLLSKDVPLGKEVIVQEDLKIDIEVTLLKVNHSLYYKDQKLETRKVKKKELRAILEGLKINNEINPLPSPPTPINKAWILTIALIVGAGLLLSWLLSDFSGFWQIPGFLIMSFGYFLAWYPLVGKGPKALVDQRMQSTLSYLLALVSTIATLIIAGYFIQLN